MKIPRKLLIKGKEWIIKKVKHLDSDPDEETQGLTTTETRSIELLKKLKGKDLEKIFWHEYMHARLHENRLTSTDGAIPLLAEGIICEDFADFMTNEIEWKWKRRKNK